MELMKTYHSNQNSFYGGHCVGSTPGSLPVSMDISWDREVRSRGGKEEARFVGLDPNRKRGKNSRK